ncbi:MAG TPA: vitamin K epoxide reductase family protein [Candidatus Manganitrophaceae bacterium]
MPADLKQKSPLGKADFVIIAASVLGMVIMAYLTYLKFSSGGLSFCDINASFSCSAVNRSIYADFFGIPVSILGFLYFAVVGGLVFSKSAERSFYSLVFGATVAALFFSLYLSYVEVFVLKTICLLCETSKALMVVIGTVSLLKMRRAKENLPFLVN